LQSPRRAARTEYSRRCGLWSCLSKNAFASGEFNCRANTRRPWTQPPKTLMKPAFSAVLCSESFVSASVDASASAISFRIAASSAGLPTTSPETAVPAGATRRAWFLFISVRTASPGCRSQEATGRTQSPRRRTRVYLGRSVARSRERISRRRAVDPLGRVARSIRPVNL
jgi:hypothetical protein